jgi:hypothetical protein
LKKGEWICDALFRVARRESKNVACIEINDFSANAITVTVRLKTEKQLKTYRQILENRAQTFP